MASSRDFSVRPLILSLLSLIAGGILGIAFMLYVSPFPVQKPVMPKDLTTAAAELKSQIETVEKKEDLILKVLAGLVTVGAILGLASTAYQLFNIKQLNDTADKQIADFEKKFPSIAKLDERMNSVLKAIIDGTELGLDTWDKDGYDRITLFQREVLRLNEASFSSLELFDFSGDSNRARSMTRIYITFGRFYGLEYLYNTANESAINRSKIYLRKAVKSGDPILRERALADLGTVSTWHANYSPDDAQKTDALKEARHSFDEACELRSYNPAALIGRAWVKKRTESPGVALRDLDDLFAAKEKLNSDEKRIYLGTAHYNRACYRVMDADPQQPAAAYRLALDDLWASKTVAEDSRKLKEWLEDLTRDATVEGELFPLQAKHATEMAQLLS